MSDAAALVTAARPTYEPGRAPVAAELEKLPASIVEELARVGVKVVVCGGSITDYATDLKGKAPRGWPKGSTWDNVPGAYLPDRHMVVIALAPAEGGGWRIPKFGEGHGSYNLIVHETIHGFDFTAHQAPSATSISPPRAKPIGINSTIMSGRTATPVVRKRSPKARPGRSRTTANRSPGRDCCGSGAVFHIGRIHPEETRATALTVGRRRLRPSSSASPT